MQTTYFVAVPFDRDPEGDLKAGEAHEFPSANDAERQAGALALNHTGAVAFSRTGDPTLGEFRDAIMLAQFGEVDLDALSV
jgi:hypothetical protein